MAASTPILTLNLGSQTMGVAEFQTQPNGGLVLTAYRRCEILADHGNESARNTQIEESLRKMMPELRVKGRMVNYAIAAQSVFARFVKLPSVEEEKIERIIAFEAQQNVPFPINEVIWDYQVVGGGTDEPLEVVLVAIKADLLEAIDAAVESGGLRTAIVDVATMALCNAFRYNHSDLPGCSLLIDLGARTTNLLFIEPGKIFSRSIAIGGASISSAIAKEFGEPMGAAEFRKKRDGFAGLGSDGAEPSDRDIARVSKIIRSTMMRLHAEILRSISYYRAQEQGSQPEHVFLCGGAAETPFLREFFREKLQLPIEFFNALRNVAVAEAVATAEVAESTHLLGELVGLALRSLITCPMELNLSPPRVVRRQHFDRRRPFFVAAAACFLLGLFAWGAYYSRAARVEVRAAERLEVKIAALRRLESQINEIRKGTASLDSFSAPLVAAINDRGFWPELLEDLNARLPKEDIWITGLVATSGGKPVGVPQTHSGRPEAPSVAPASQPPAPASSQRTIDGILVRGLYLFNPKQQEVVVDFFRNLLSSTYFVIDPNDQSKVIKPTTPNNSEWAFPYELRLELRKPIKLP